MLRKRKETVEHISRYAALAQKSHTYNQQQHKEYLALLESILPADFLSSRTVIDLNDSPRYFQALAIRIERAHANPAKDLTKNAQLRPFIDKLNSIPVDRKPLPPDCREAISLYTKMVNDFRVTLFAPELKGGQAVSPKKLTRQWQTIQSICP